ncbi:MAG TPA: hypothetical protein VKE95_20910 [Burkholderiales bacterium]|nr:hypothetical protein [Burkholderiales bacterium]
MARISTAAAALLLGSAVAQEPREGERPVRPDNASNAAIGGWCDALTGAKKEQCLRDERRREDEKAAQGGASTRGSCDSFIGPDKARCLRQGGTVEVDAEVDPGGVRSPVPPSSNQ